MSLKQNIRSRLLQFLKNYFNPLTLRIAHSSFGPFAIIKHVGRRSGKAYETPIIVRPIEQGFVIELTYGYEVDWYKNVLAAGSCTVLWHGKQYQINGVRPIDTETGLAAFPLPIRAMLRLANKKDFVELLMEDAAYFNLRH